MSGESTSPPGSGCEYVVATSNPGKLREIRAILVGESVQLSSLDSFPRVEFPVEGDDYSENAIAKARAVARAIGRPAVGDDSGLEVAGLDGAPGPRSARFGGPGLDDAGRVAALLQRMNGMEGADRAACFVCVAALVMPDGSVVTARGECAGRILSVPRGRGGFGYDPIFEAEGAAGTMAELGESEKHRISHRGQALRALWKAHRA